MQQKLNSLTLYVTGNTSDSYRFPYKGKFEELSYEGWNFFLDPVSICQQALSMVLEKNPDQMVIFAVEENCIMASLICAFVRSKMPTLPVSLLLDTIPPNLGGPLKPSFSLRHDMLISDPKFIQSLKRYGDLCRILDEMQPFERPRYIHAMFPESENFKHLREASMRCSKHLSIIESFHVPKSTRYYMLSLAASNKRSRNTGSIDLRVEALHNAMSDDLFE